MIYLISFTLLLGLIVPSICLADEFTSIGGFLAQIIDIMIGFGAVAALFGLIFAGYKYITSQGNPEAVGSAKNSALYAIVGLIVILIAVLFINFFLDSLGADLPGVN